ncbi:MAG: ribonuclease P protein component [Ignavibacteria bacterium]|nr:ribonuclease P protein component [Ignavibacteria bacterium]
MPIIKRNIPKSEIIRGFNAYKDTIKSSKNKIHGNIKVYYKFDKPEVPCNILKTDDTVNPQVGFIVSKKLISKSVLRNKIRRQLKESYREVKREIIKKYKPTETLKIIFTLSGKGNDILRLNGKLNYTEIRNDMTAILNKIFSELRIPN